MGSIVLCRVRPLCRIRGVVSTHDVVDWITLYIPFCLSIIEYMIKELIQHIDAIAWDDSADAGSKILGIQSLLYQWEQMQDAKSVTLEEQQLDEGFRR